MIDNNKTYIITIKDDKPRIKCLNCGLTSYNPNDVRYRFCGKCKKFHK